MNNRKCIEFTYDPNRLDAYNMNIGSIQCLFDELQNEADLFVTCNTIYPSDGEALHTEASMRDVDVYDYALELLEEIGGDLARLRIFEALGIVSDACVDEVRNMLIDLRRFYTEFIRTSAIWKG